MIDPVTDELAECLESIEKGETTFEEYLAEHPEHQAELSELVEISRLLIAAPKVQPSPEFVRNSPLRLHNRISVRRMKVLPRTQGAIIILDRLIASLLRPAWAIPLLVAIFLTVVGTGTVHAANESIPGDWLYPLKQTIETARLAVAPEDTAVKIRIELAETRAEEIDALINKGRYDRIDETANNLEVLSKKATEGLSTIEKEHHELAQTLAGELNSALANNVSVLSGVLNQVPETAKPAILHAISVSNHEKSSVDEEQPGANGTAGSTEPTMTEPAEQGTATPTQIAPNGIPGQNGNPEKPTDKPHEKPTLTNPGKEKTPPPGQSNRPTSGSGNSAPPGVGKSEPPIPRPENIH